MKRLLPNGRIPRRARLVPALVLLPLASACTTGVPLAPRPRPSADPRPPASAPAPSSSTTSRASPGTASTKPAGTARTSGEAQSSWGAGAAPTQPRKSWSEHIQAGRKAFRSRDVAVAESEFRAAYEVTRGYRRADPRTVTTVHHLERVATAYLSDRRTADFERLMELLARVGEEEPAARSPELASLFAALAKTQTMDGDAAGARDSLERALAFAGTAERQATATTAGIEAQLGLTYVSLGDENAARTHVARALEIAQAAEGPEGLVYAQALLARARLEGKIGDADRAEADALQAIAIYEKKLGPTHSSTASARRELALFYENEGRDEEAIAQLDRVIEIWDGLPKEIYQQAMSRNELAWFLLTIGRPKEAEEPARAAIALLTANSIDGQPLAAIADTLATALRDQGKYEEAEGLYQEALDEGEKAQGLPGWDVGEIAARYAVLLEQTGRDDEARALLARWAPSTDASP